MTEELKKTNNSAENIYKKPCKICLNKPIPNKYNKTVKDKNCGLMIKNCSEKPYNPIKTLQEIIEKIKDKTLTDAYNPDCKTCFCPPIDVAYYTVMQDLACRFNSDGNKDKDKDKESDLDKIDLENFDLENFEEVDLKEVFKELINMGIQKWEATILYKWIENQTLTLYESKKSETILIKLINIYKNEKINELFEGIKNVKKNEIEEFYNEIKEISDIDLLPNEKSKMITEITPYNNIIKNLFDICKYFMNNADTLSVDNYEEINNSLQTIVDNLHSLEKKDVSTGGKRQYHLKTKKKLYIKKKNISKDFKKIFKKKNFKKSKKKKIIFLKKSKKFKNKGGGGGFRLKVIKFIAPIIAYVLCAGIVLPTKLGFLYR